MDFNPLVKSVITNLLAIYRDVLGNDAYYAVVADLQSKDEVKFEKALEKLTLMLGNQEVNKVITGDLIDEITFTDTQLNS